MTSGYDCGIYEKCAGNMIGILLVKHVERIAVDVIGGILNIL